MSTANAQGENVQTPAGQGSHFVPRRKLSLFFCSALQPSYSAQKQKTLRESSPQLIKNYSNTAIDSNHYKDSHCQNATWINSRPWSSEPLFPSLSQTAHTLAKFTLKLVCLEWTSVRKTRLLGDCHVMVHFNYALLQSSALIEHLLAMRRTRQ